MRFTLFLVLLFVLVVNGLKEVYEDVQRHKSDKKINLAKVNVLRGRSFIQIEWQQLKIGDIIKLENNEQIPADCLIVSTSNKNFSCYIETCNLFFIIIIIILFFIIFIIFYFIFYFYFYFFIFQSQFGWRI